MIRKSVFMVAYKEEKEIKYLVMKRILHWEGWEFPKGGIEDNESRNATIKRELKEEAGLKPERIIDMKIRGKWDYEKEIEDRPEVTGQSYELFAVEVFDDEVNLDKEEHSGYKWMEFNDAYNLLTWENQKSCLIEVNKFLIEEKLRKEFKGYRVYVSSSGAGIIGGKDEEQNEELMKKFIGKNFIIAHTKKPGSPFCINVAGKSEEKEMALFCAKFSRDWKQNNGDVEVHIFSGKNVYKTKEMKTGTFGVKKV